MGENAAYLVPETLKGGGERRMPRSGDALGRSAKLMLRQRQAAFSSLKNPIF